LCNEKVFDADNGSLLLTEEVREFTGGTYLQLRLTGHVEIRITSLGSSSGVVSGIFFDD
jgi:hypothetical protein